MHSILRKQDIEASDRELVTNVLSPMAVNRKVEKWEKTLEDHVTNTDTLRMLQITETSPQRRLSVTELAESETSAERGEVSLLLLSDALVPETHFHFPSTLWVNPFF